MISAIHHVALLVRSLRRSADAIARLGLPVGDAQSFPGEGTTEIYCGDETHETRLLLLEATSDGPYARAMTKRGPGLHHVAIDVVDIDAFLARIAATRWKLHSLSARMLIQSRTAFLSTKGLPSLIEVQERAAVARKPAFATRLALPSSVDHAAMSSVGLEHFIVVSSVPRLELGPHNVDIAELCTL